MFTDPILKKLVKHYPAPSWTDRSEYLFEDMIETIISQQLSGKAADTILKRFQQLFTTSSTEVVGKRRFNPNLSRGRKKFPTPKEVHAIDDEKIRGAGVSHAKTQYIKNVAAAFIAKDIEVKKIKQMSDEEVIITLTKIKGIGRWSAEMVLLFTLNRPDVFSIGDLGLRNAIKNLYGITDQKEILALTETWKPNRSLACWYLWRSLEKK